MKKTIFYITLLTFFEVVYGISNDTTKPTDKIKINTTINWDHNEQNLCVLNYSVWHKIKEITSLYTTEQLIQLKNVDLKVGHITFKRKKGCKGYTNYCINKRFQYPHVFCGNKGCRLDGIIGGKLSHNIPGQDENIAYQNQELKVTCRKAYHFNRRTSIYNKNSFYCTSKGINYVTSKLCESNACNVPIKYELIPHFNVRFINDCRRYVTVMHQTRGRCEIKLKNSAFLNDNGFPVRNLEFYCDKNFKSHPEFFDVRRNRCFLDKIVHNLMETVEIETIDFYVVKCSAYAFSIYEKVYCDIDSYTKLFYWGIPNNNTDKINRSEKYEKLDWAPEIKRLNNSLDIEKLRAKNKYTNLFEFGYDDRDASVKKICKFLDCRSAIGKKGISCKDSFCEINEAYHIEFYGKIYYSLIFLCENNGIPFVTRENECKAKIESLDKLQIISNESCYKDSNSEYLSIKKSCVVRGAEGYQITGIKGVDQKIVCLTDTAYKPEIVSVKIQYCDLPEIINGIYLDDCKTTKKGFKCYYICSHDDYLGLKFSGYIECKDNPKMEGTIAFTSNPTCSENKLTNDIWLFCFMAGIFVLFDWIIMMFYVHDEK